MISRRTTSRLADYYANRFIRSVRAYGGGFKNEVDHLDLYRHLYDHEFPAYICNSARKLRGSPENLRTWVQRIHTGETLIPATKSWDPENRRARGQQHLGSMFRAIRQDHSRQDTYVSKQSGALFDVAMKALESDGYEWRGDFLLAPEQDALDQRELRGVIRSLVDELQLDAADIAAHHLSQSTKMYEDEQWNEVIGNARSFLERVFLSVALRHSRVSGETLKRGETAGPKGVRQYLENHGLIDAQENKALAEVYFLLSARGSHPYMAESDQARLLRNLALTLSQFVMLRLSGYLCGQ